MWRIFSSLLLFSSISHCQSFDRDLDDLMRQSAPVGRACMIFENDKLLYQKGSGFANFDTEESITARSNFRMASVSKQFTAACIILLKNEGKLSYEDSILKFLPEFNSEVGKKVRLKHLLTHSSGLVDYEDLIPKEQENQLTDADVVAFIKNEKDTYFEPGSAYQYSNSGFCVLEQIIERISGETYPEFIKKHIFLPLGMANSYLYQKGAAMPNRALGYAKNDHQKIVFSDQSITSATMGDGCVYTSLQDYQKWLKALAQNRLFNILMEIKTVNRPIEISGGLSYGLGWFNAGGELYHTGSTCGFSNVVWFNPERKSAIVYFSNLADNHADFEKVREIASKHQIFSEQVDFKVALKLTN